MSNTQQRKEIEAERKRGATKPVRLKHGTVKKLQKILAQVNKKEFGKKVRPDAVVDVALSLLGSDHIEQLRSASMTNADRLETSYRQYVAKNGCISKDDFIGLLLRGREGILSIEDLATQPKPSEPVFRELA